MRTTKTLHFALYTTKILIMSNFHIPVLLEEVIDGLNIQPGAWYIDCNLGGGGHTEAILKQGGKVLGIDLDGDAILEVAKNHTLEIVQKEDHLEAFSDHLILYQANFSKVQHIVNQLNLKDIRGILFDLGVSSFQLDEDKRGFSFTKNAPLDMRMNQSANIPTAADLINALHEGELAELFSKFGEENFTRPIAKKIVEHRKIKRIETTDELARVILSFRKRNHADKTHPATRVFQALRIAVNDELNTLKDTLPISFNVLDSGGRLVVISFHSLEDRIVKNYFKELEDQDKAKLLTKKPLVPKENEETENPRSRSSKLRVLEKI